MAGIGGLAIILLGGLTGFVFALLAMVLVIHGCLTRHPRRGFITGMIALALSVLGVLLSFPIWTVILSGHDTHGEPLNYGEASPFIILVAVEGVAILASIANAVRRASLRKA